MATGTITYDKKAGPLGIDAQPIGSGGLNVLGSEPTQIARVAKGKVLWKRPTKSVFGAGATTSWGWWFQYAKKKDLFIGAVGIRPRPTLSDEQFDDLKAYTVHLRDDVLAVIGGKTGKVIWRAKGSDPWCTSGLGTSATRLHGGKSYLVRCEYLSGTYKVPGNGTYRKAKARLVGYDPLTGKTAWKSKTVEVTKSGQLLHSTAGHGEYVLTGKPGGNLVIDTASGKTRKPATGETFFCTSSGSYALPIEPHEDSASYANGRLMLASCKATGKKAKGYTVGAVRDVDNIERGRTLIAEEDGVSGFKLPSGQKS